MAFIKRGYPQGSAVVPNMQMWSRIIEEWLTLILESKPCQLHSALSPVPRLDANGITELIWVHLWFLNDLGVLSVPYNVSLDTMFTVSLHRREGTSVLVCFHVCFLSSLWGALALCSGGFDSWEGTWRLMLIVHILSLSFRGSWDFLSPW